MSKGSAGRRCSCRDENGRLGKRCPLKLSLTSVPLTAKCVTMCLAW